MSAQKLPSTARSILSHALVSIIFCQNIKKCSLSVHGAMHLNRDNSVRHSVSSMTSEIDTDTDYSDNQDSNFIENVKMKATPEKLDVRRKIEDILEAKRLRAEFDS